MRLQAESSEDTSRWAPSTPPMASTSSTSANMPVVSLRESTHPGYAFEYQATKLKFDQKEKQNDASRSTSHEDRSETRSRNVSRNTSSEIPQNLDNSSDSTSLDCRE